MGKLKLDFCVAQSFELFVQKQSKNNLTKFHIEILC